MRIDTRKVIKDYEGKDIEDDEVVDGKKVKKPYTIREAIAVAINSQSRDEVLTAEHKTKVYGISTKLYQNHEIDLTVDDRAFIKERAGKVMSALVYGRLCELFEEKKEEPKEAPKEEPKPQA